MKTRFHELTAWLLTLAMLMTFIPSFAFSVSAAETVANGTCGTGVNWVLDSDGVLTVSGSGKMNDYRSVMQIPYYSYKEQIKSVVIENGVTYIGNNAFHGCTNLQSLTIMGDLDKIGARAFFSCNAITTITYYGVNAPELGSSVGLEQLSIKVTVPENYAEGVDKFAGLQVFRTLPATGGEAETPTYEVKILRHTTDTGVAVKSIISDGKQAERATHKKDLTVLLKITGEGTADDVYVRYISIGAGQSYYLSDEECPITLDEENLTLTIPGELVDGTVEIDTGIMLDVIVNLEGGYLKNTSYAQRWYDADPSDDVAVLSKEYAFYGYGGSWAWNECFAKDGYILNEITSNLPQHGPYDPNREIGPVLERDIELTLVWEPDPNAPVTHTVSVTANPAESGTVSGDGEYEEGEEVTVTATANDGYKFVNWTENGEVVNTDASYTFTVTADRELEAVFEREAAPIAFDGAQIRISGEQGLRFVFSMSREYYATLTHPTSYTQTGEGFGGVALPTDRIEGELTKDSASCAIVPAVVLFDETDTTVRYTVCLTGISDYEREYSVIPYVTDAEGNTIYGELADGISVYEIAELVYASENESEQTKQYLLENILNRVAPEKYPIA